MRSPPPSMKLFAIAVTGALGLAACATPPAAETVVATSAEPKRAGIAYPAPEPMPPPPPTMAIARMPQPSLPGEPADDAPAPQIPPLAPLWAASSLPVESPQWPTVFDGLIRQSSRRYYPLLDWQWLRALGIAESSLRADAISPAGAQGLMQIMPDTWALLAEELPSVSDPMNARDSALAGAHYHRWLWDGWSEIGDDLQRMAFTMASYHAGVGRIRHAWHLCGYCQQWHVAARNAPQSTRAHVRRIMTLMGHHVG